MENENDVVVSELNTTLEWLRQEVAANNLTQKEIAQAIGYSNTVINQFLQGKYTGDSSHIMERMVQYIRRLHNSKDLLQTKAAKAAFDFFDLVKNDNSLAVLLGDSGVGKTKISQSYAFTRERVAYCCAVQAMNSREILISMANSILSTPPSGTVYECQLSIEQALRQRPRMIIVDQADLLNVKTLDIIRSIHDDGHCSMVLVGLPYLESLMKRGPRSRENLAYLYSRVGYMRFLPRPDRVDIRVFAKKYDLEISELFADEMMQWIRNAGELRTCHHLMARARDLKGKVGNSDEDAIRAARGVLLKKD